VKRKATDHSNKVRNGSTISFHSINYTIELNRCCIIISCLYLKEQTKKRVLWNLTVIFKSGMNAILRPTRNGKSSLLYILADRKDRRECEGEFS